MKFLQSTRLKGKKSISYQFFCISSVLFMGIWLNRKVVMYLLQKTAENTKLPQCNAPQWPSSWRNWSWVWFTEWWSYSSGWAASVIESLVSSDLVANEVEYFICTAFIQRQTVSCQSNVDEGVVMGPKVSNVWWITLIFLFHFILCFIVIQRDPWIVWPARTILRILFASKRYDLAVFDQGLKHLQ